MEIPTRSAALSAVGTPVALRPPRTDPDMQFSRIRLFGCTRFRVRPTALALFAIPRSQVGLQYSGSTCPAQVSFAGFVLSSSPSPCTWLSHAASRRNGVTHYFFILFFQPPTTFFSKQRYHKVPRKVNSCFSRRSGRLAKRGRQSITKYLSLTPYPCSLPFYGQGGLKCASNADSLASRKPYMPSIISRR